MRLFLFSVALFLTGITTTSRAQTVAGAIGSGKVARGATVTGNITLNIPPGLHVNSNQPRSRYAIPTTITMTLCVVSGLSWQLRIVVPELHWDEMSPKC